ncbi:recombinase family protein [Micromonospora aurantiaca (nom. illeg.)]|uniref:recombinase family protein n=1 Tax=Micromonospora aurantiaca (nom. illeg.) TaxID=47850 RepID=UPI0033D60E5F
MIRPRLPQRPFRVAFYGAAREDAARHLAMQYQQCRDAVPGRHLTVAFYDTIGAVVPTPPQFTINETPVWRAGGLAELLLEASMPERRFDFVIVTDLDRLGRHIGRVSDILRRLIRCEVELLTVPDPDDSTPDVPRLPLLRLRSLNYLDTILDMAREGDFR